MQGSQLLLASTPFAACNLRLKFKTVSDSRHLSRSLPALLETRHWQIPIFVVELWGGSAGHEDHDGGAE
jgi:hypothetical protein